MGNLSHFITNLGSDPLKIICIRSICHSLKPSHYVYLIFPLRNLHRNNLFQAPRSICCWSLPKISIHQQANCINLCLYLHLQTGFTQRSHYHNPVFSWLWPCSFYFCRNIIIANHPHAPIHRHWPCPPHSSSSSRATKCNHLPGIQATWLCIQKLLNQHKNTLSDPLADNALYCIEATHFFYLVDGSLLI